MIMSWWHPFIPWRSDDEIARYVCDEVEAGRIPPAMARACERALRDEAAGKCVIMRKPHIVRRLPRSPEEARRLRAR
jgi:hypothetical protein